jgi:choline dehydrogenase-like flavoprotein
MVGGRTNHWGRISLRFGPDDFMAKSRDGLGDDWPIGYADVAPYYDRIDKLIGVFGNNDNLPNHPGGYFLPPPKPRCYELMVKDAADRLNITCVAARRSMQSRLHDQLQLFIDQRPYRARAQDWTADAGDPRNGSRGDPQR